MYLDSQQQADIARICELKGAASQVLMIAAVMHQPFRVDDMAAHGNYSREAVGIACKHLLALGHIRILPGTRKTYQLTGGRLQALSFMSEFPTNATVNKEQQSSILSDIPTNSGRAVVVRTN